jgi:hydroxyacylglutathione hydrolase
VPYQITPITNAIVSCYLVKTGDGFFMVDAGVPFFRDALKKTLKAAGCKKGNLKFVVITHGDFDHTGSARYLQEKYGAKVIAHKLEAKAIEKGDMTSNRKRKLGRIFKTYLLLFKVLILSRVKPDKYIDGDFNLAEYGIAAKIVAVPGHSVGSIGVITEDGHFFCGDLLNNTGAAPRKNPLMDDESAMDASIARLKKLNVRKIYPGHGKPFTLDEFLKK